VPAPYRKAGRPAPALRDAIDGLRNPASSAWTASATERSAALITSSISRVESWSMRAVSGWRVSVNRCSNFIIANHSKDFSASSLLSHRKSHLRGYAVPQAT
jgi:hypothetical protein